MNKLITTDTGGFPLQLDDLRFIDDSVRNAILGILSSYGATTAGQGFILSGCEVTDGGSNWDISAGYICLAGEVLQVLAHSVTKTLGGGQGHYYRVITANDPAGLKTFQSTISYQTYQIRQAEVVVATASGPEMGIEPDTIALKIASIIRNHEEAPNEIAKGMFYNPGSGYTTGSYLVDTIADYANSPTTLQGFLEMKPQTHFTISGWNMNGGSVKVVELAGINRQNICAVDVMIHSDSGNKVTPLITAVNNGVDDFFVAQGAIEIYASGGLTYIEMSPAPPYAGDSNHSIGNNIWGGIWEGNEYDGSGFRGYINITEKF